MRFDADYYYENRLGFINSIFHRLKSSLGSENISLRPRALLLKINNLNISLAVTLYTIDHISLEMLELGLGGDITEMHLITELENEHDSFEEYMDYLTAGITYAYKILQKKNKNTPVFAIVNEMRESMKKFDATYFHDTDFGKLGFFESKFKNLRSFDTFN